MSLKELKDKIINEAKVKEIKDIEGLSSFLEQCNEEDILLDILDKITKLDKWRYSIKVTYFPKWKVELRMKTSTEIGKPLEDLAEIALKDLGCKVIGQSNRFTILTGLPDFPEHDKFKDKGYVFKRNLNVPHMADFVGQNVPIVIEVKNIDPAKPYRTYDKFKEDVLDRFKVRKRKRYLLIPEGVLTPEQRTILKNRKILEINIRQQLRRNNKKEVYSSVFYALEHILFSI